MLSDKVLYAFYDFAISPVTFDLVQFLVLAESERKKLNCDSLHIVFVPGPNDGFSPVEISVYRKLGQKDCDIDSMRWRLRNIMLSLCWLIPSCRGITVCTSLEEARILQNSIAKYVFPRDYDVQFPKEGYSLFELSKAESQGDVSGYIQATSQARRFVKEWIDQRDIRKRKIIAITLRWCPYQRERNNNMKAWSKFIKSLDPTIYYPIVVRDTWTAFKPLPLEFENFCIFEEACWNMELRIALYELCYLNLSVNCGPIVLCIFDSRTRYLLFRRINLSGINMARFFRSEGLEVDSQYRHATPFQRVVWKDDTYPIIQEEFEKMCKKIEKKKEV